MAFKTAKDVIRAKIRKLEQLEKLLDDPDIAAILPELQASRIANVTNRNQLKLPVTAPKKKVGRKPGPLAEKAFEVVKNAMAEISARDVAAKLQESGFVFRVRDREVATSKALRKLAKQGKLATKRSGPGKKSAILYMSNAIAQSFPVQETTQ